MTLAQFPNGCHGCGGACCKLVGGKAPPWTTAELDAIPERAVKQVDYSPTWGACPELTADGLCGIHDDRPEKCGCFQIGGTDCIAVRLTAGVQ